MSEAYEKRDELLMDIHTSVTRMETKVEMLGDKMKAHEETLQSHGTTLNMGKGFLAAVSAALGYLGIHLK